MLKRQNLIYLYHKLRQQAGSTLMYKNFLFPQNMVRTDVSDGFFGGLYRCGSAAFLVGLYDELRTYFTRN
jgi:hypothetical protein